MARPKKGEELEGSTYFGTRIDRNTRDGLERLAKATGRTIAQEAREALERHVKTDKRRK